MKIEIATETLRVSSQWRKVGNVPHPTSAFAWRIAVVLTLIVYIALGKYLVGGLMSGSVKG